MDPILDAEPKFKPQGTLFSKLSLISSIAGLFSLYQVFSTAKLVLNQAVSFTDLRIITMVFVFFSLTGLAFTIISIVKREQAGPIKTAGVFLNVFLLFLIIGFLIFARH